LPKGAWGPKQPGPAGGGSIIVSIPPHDYGLKIFFDNFGKNGQGGQSIPVKVDFNGVLVS
jgi:hypothetical protein